MGKIADLKDVLTSIRLDLPKSRPAQAESFSVSSVEKDLTDIFRPDLPKRRDNSTNVDRLVLQDTLVACADMERVIKELQPDPIEIGYIDGYIYGYTNEAFSTYIKVGRSINPSNRPKAWQTGNPIGKYHEEFRIWVTEYTKVEFAVHKLLGRWRVVDDREWFNCTVWDAIDAIKQVIHSTPRQCKARHIT